MIAGKGKQIAGEENAPLYWRRSILGAAASSSLGSLRGNLREEKGER